MWSGIAAATSSISSAAEQKNWNPARVPFFVQSFILDHRGIFFQLLAQTLPGWLRNLRSAFARLHKLDRFFAGDAFWCELEDAERRPMAADLLCKMIGRFVGRVFVAHVV